MLVSFVIIKMFFFDRQMESYIDIQCTMVSTYPVQSIATCVRMRTLVRKVLRGLKVSAAHIH